MQSKRSCSDCGGKRVWQYTGAIKQEEWCPDCSCLCDCGKIYRRTAAKCPDCGDAPPTESDEARVVKLIAILHEHGGNPTIFDKLAKFGPAARIALPWICACYLKEGTGNFTGAAAHDALRDHGALEDCQCGKIGANAKPAASAETKAAVAPSLPFTVKDGKIHFQCAKCNHSVSIAIAHAGKKGKCPGCGTTMTIPSPAPPAPAAPAPPKPSRPVPSPALLRRFPKEAAVQQLAVPLGQMGAKMALLSASTSEETKQALEFILNGEVMLVPAELPEIEELIAKYYP